ncbi:MAG: response regulator [Candidatus Aureabacteria bacterium]|nr:response regulator [Candidatus Auribacterota bacterium]
MINNQKKILIIEDDALFSQTLRIFFEKEGMEVSESSTVKESLEKCREMKPDFVIVDICLPEELGISFSKSVGEKPDLYGSPKIIGISGLTGAFLKEGEEKLKKFNLHFFLKKPFELNELKNLINESVS